MSKKKKALEYLKIVRKATSLQIREIVNTVAPASMMADLRKIGCNIASNFYIPLRKVFRSGSMKY